MEHCSSLSRFHLLVLKTHLYIPVKKESGLLFHSRKMKYTTTSDSVFNIKEQPPTHMH